jgi:hypothetical protein
VHQLRLHVPPQALGVRSCNKIRDKTDQSLFTWSIDDTNKQ